MKRSVLLLLLMASLTASVHAIPTPLHSHVKTELKKDTAQVNMRHFNSKALENYNKQLDFNYAEKKNHTPSWWTRFWNWVWAMWNGFWDWVGELLRKLFGSASGGKNAASALKYMLIGVVVLALIYLVSRLIGIDLLSLFRKKKSKGVDVPYTESLENIHDINFDQDIEAAIQVKNYRLAVRLLYLRCLKQLNDAGAINWRMEKTNSAYINELTDADQRQQFAAITRQFEYAWYGDFPVDSESFQRINLLFHDFKKHATAS